MKNRKSSALRTSPSRASDPPLGSPLGGPPHRCGRPVLLADDDDAIREILAEVIGLDGVRMSGWDLLAAMRDCSELRVIPTVVVSASAGIAEGIPAARYLAKPVHPEDLVYVVTSLCESFHRSNRALTFDGTSA
jgi:hypothetical protein